MKPTDGGRASQVETATRGGDLLPRILSSIVLVGIAALGAWWGGLATAAVVAAVVAVVHREWTTITEGAGLQAILFTIAVVAVMLVYGIGYPEAALLLAVLAVVAALVIGPRPWRPGGVVYASTLGLSLLVLRNSDSGLAAVAILFAAVWGTDIGAYFAGRAIGGPKLWPAVSPKKTWAGAVGGLAAAIVASLATAAIVGVPPVAPLVAVACALSIAGQLGDLFESYIKRRFDVKDSGSIIPGHGGMMDRVDGLIFASAVAVVIGLIHSAGMDTARGLIWW